VNLEQALAILWLSGLLTVVGASLLSRYRVRSGMPARRAMSLSFIEGGLAASAALIIISSLLPLDIFLHPQTEVNVVPLVSIWRSLTDAPGSDPLRTHVLNLLLYVPFGSFVEARTRRPVLVVWAIGLMVSAGVESFQYTFLEGRTTDVDDILLNGLGALVGGLLARLVFQAVHGRFTSRKDGRADPREELPEPGRS